MKPDNRDLAMRRLRCGLSQQDVGDLLCGFDPQDEAQRGKGISYSSVSRFETGEADSLPPAKRGDRRLTREDYERLLGRLEKKRSRK